jgi:hypothetical protein
MRRFSLQVPRRRAQGCNGFHGERLLAKKPLRRFLRFPRGTDSLQRPVPVGQPQRAPVRIVEGIASLNSCSTRCRSNPHSEPRRGSLSDRILIAKTVALDSESRIGAAVWRPVSTCHRFTRPGTWTRAPVSRSKSILKSHARGGYPLARALWRPPERGCRQVAQRS